MGMIAKSGMTEERAREARRLLVEGYAIDVQGRTHRVYPSHVTVARDVGVPPSTVTRWAAQAGIAQARADVLEGDRAAAATAPATPMTVEQIVRGVAVALTARLNARRAVPTRDLDRALRMFEWVAGLEPALVSDVTAWQQLLKRLLGGRARAR